MLPHASPIAPELRELGGESPAASPCAECVVKALVVRDTPLVVSFRGLIAAAFVFMVCAATDGGGSLRFVGLAHGSEVGSFPNEYCRAFCAFAGTESESSGWGAFCWLLECSWVRKDMVGCGRPAHG